MVPVITGRNRRMDTRLLETFVAVAEELHFRRAAERLHVAQPAVSRQIRRLEDELGVQLLIRDRRKVMLTEAGQAYLGEARTILSRLEVAQQEARRVERGEVGSLSVGYTQLFVMHGVFPETVRLYRERFPGVELQMRELLTSEQVEALLEGNNIDVGLGTLPVTAEGLRTETLLEEPLVVALPANHPLTTKKQVVLEELADEPFILFPRWQAPEFHDLLIGVCREAGFVPQVVVEATSLPSVASMVAAGIGVAFVARITFESGLQRPRVVYKEIDECDIRLRGGLLWRPENETPVLRGFLEVIREAFRTYSSERKVVGS
jgi:DNA-binding transcriptional LysR family regulator